MTYKNSVVLPELTVTPKRTYVHNPYDNTNIFGNGGDKEITAFTPIAHPVIPKVHGDQEAVNWLADWYNNRRKQMYNNLKDYDTGQTYLYNAKDFLTGNPIGRRAINHDYYDKLSFTKNYSPADFNELEHDSPYDYDNTIERTVGFTVPEMRKIYYNKDLLENIKGEVTKNQGFSPLGVHIHERTHTLGPDDGKYSGYNVQTKALEDIIKLKKGQERDDYLDNSTEIYARMMEFRYNHGLDPKKKYTKGQIQKYLNQEVNKKYRSELQRYDLDSLTKALNEVAYTDVKPEDIMFDMNLT